MYQYTISCKQIPSNTIKNHPHTKCLSCKAIMLCVDEIEIQIGKSYEILGWIDCDLESLDLRIWLRWLSWSEENWFVENKKELSFTLKTRAARIGLTQFYCEIYFVYEQYVRHQCWAWPWPQWWLHCNAENSTMQNSFERRWTDDTWWLLQFSDF